MTSARTLTSPAVSAPKRLGCVSLLAPIAASLLLAGCNATSRLQQIGAEPPLTQIQDPNQQPGYKPVSLPMPAPISGERRPNSLWQAGTRAFFKDQRAAQIGDILTVIVDINEKAKLGNESVRTRDNTEKAGLSHLLGFEKQLQRILPSASDPTQLLDANAASKSDGKGTIDRSEQVTVKVAMLVTQVLPNGNLVVQGRQEMRVNFEIRELQITGVIRPQDISATNTITLDKIAEARVSYGGRGQNYDVQQPRYGQQFFDIVMPF